MRALVFATIFLVLALPTGASAQPTPRASEVEPAPRTMSLDEALAFAKAHQPRLTAAHHRLLAAEREVEVPQAQWLPRVGAMAQIVGSTTNNSTTTFLGTPTVDLTRIGATPVSGSYDLTPAASTAAAIGVRQQLYDFGRTAAETTAAGLAVAVERHRLTGSRFEVEFLVKQAYFAVLASVAIFDASRAAFERSASHRDLARANVRTGLRPPIEATRAEADVARYEAGMLRARASIRIARMAFAAVVGIDDSELGATAPTSPAPELSLRNAEALVGQVDRSPIVLEARARIEAQRAETRRLEAQTRPMLLLTAAFSGRGGGAQPSAGPTPYGEGWLPVVPNYNAALVFSWPLFEPAWSRRADASREREAAAAAEAELVSRTQRAVVRSAHQEAIVARETLAAVERSAEAARANWDQAEHRFGVGLGTSTELADAQALRSEADIQLAIARFQTARAEAALERAAAAETSEGR